MVVTPWGSSETLREGMLPPGPGSTPEAVAENQKRRLFGAMVASVAERGYWNTRVVEVVLGGIGADSWEEESRRRLATFAQLVDAQPAAARLFLIEAYVAGPEAVAVVDEMSKGVEELVRQRLASSEEWADLPPEIGTVAVASILEAFRTRLLKGQTQRLPE